MISISDDQITSAVLALVAARGPSKTICPSEAARLLATERGLADWRVLMPQVHASVERLARAGRVAIRQGGIDVGSNQPHGPYRVALRPVD